MDVLEERDVEESKKANAFALVTEGATVIERPVWGASSFCRGNVHNKTCHFYSSLQS